MAIDTITPAADNVLQPGDSISFRVDDTYTTMLVEVETLTGWEIAYDSSLGGAQPGYTVAVTIPTAGRHLFTITKSVGWNLNPFTVRVTENEAGPSAVTTTNYYLASQVEFPRGSDPYFGNYQGDLLITDDGVQVRNDVKWIDIKGTGYTLTDSGNGKVTLELTGGGGGGGTTQMLMCWSGNVSVNDTSAYRGPSPADPYSPTWSTTYGVVGGNAVCPNINNLFQYVAPANGSFVSWTAQGRVNGACEGEYQLWRFSWDDGTANKYAELVDTLFVWDGTQNGSFVYKQSGVFAANSIVETDFLVILYKPSVGVSASSTVNFSLVFEPA